MCDTINTNSVKSRLLHVYTVLLINIGSFVMLLDGRSQHISLLFHINSGGLHLSEIQVCTITR